MLRSFASCGNSWMHTTVANIARKRLLSSMFGFYKRTKFNSGFKEVSVEYWDIQRFYVYFFSSSREAYVKNCNCLMNCNITIYSTKIVNRREMDELNTPNSMLTLYYSSNLVTKLSEVVGYDWNQFLSDIGGSLGFLLGNIPDSISDTLTNKPLSRYFCHWTDIDGRGDLSNTVQMDVL